MKFTEFENDNIKVKEFCFQCRNNNKDLEKDLTRNEFINLIQTSTIDLIEFELEDVYFCGYIYFRIYSESLLFNTISSDKWICVISFRELKDVLSLFNDNSKINLNGKEVFQEFLEKHKELSTRK